MKKIKAQLSVFLSFLFLGLSGVLQAQKPNIVVIVTDDQGYNDLDVQVDGYSSNPRSYLRTPNIKTLAASSWFFKNAYTSGNICSPTRAGIMTGRYQQRNGIYTGGSGDLGMPNEVLTIPRVLKNNDYDSGAFGKWHAGECAGQQDPIAKGFGAYLGYFAKGGHDYFKMRESEYYINGDVNGQEIPDLNNYAMMVGDKIMDIDDTDYPTINNDVDERTGEPGVYMTRLLSYEAVEFIKEKANKSKPFFCYVAYTALHSPAQVPVADKQAFLNRPSTPDDLGFEARNDKRATLMAMLDVLDEGIGQIVNELKSQNVYDDTLIIYLSDNGGDGKMTADNGILRGFKQENYQGGIKTPFILSWPNGFPTSGKVIDTPIMSFDIFPTLLDAADIPFPSSVPFDGKSVLPLLEGNTNHHDAMFWSEGGERFDNFLFLDNGGDRERPKGEFAVIDGDWKIYSNVTSQGSQGGTVYSDIKVQLELYNLKNDPGETTNLYNENKEGVALDLLTKYETWLSEMSTPIKGSNAKAFYIPITNSDAAAVYNEVYYGGDLKRIQNPGKYNTSDLPFGDNEIRSIVVQRGYIATLYEDDNQQGNSFTVKGSGQALFFNGLDKKVSSMEIKKGYGDCNGEVDITYSGNTNRPERNPERLMDYNFSNDTGKFRPNVREGGATVRFKLCKAQKLYGLGVSFKTRDCNFTQELDIELSNNGGATWTEVVKNGENVTAREGEVVFTFPSQEATDLRVNFRAYTDLIPDRPEILEVEIKYGEQNILSNENEKEVTAVSPLSVWQLLNQDIVNIKSTSTIDAFKVYNMEGAEVISKKNINANKTDFKTGKLATGVYVVEVKTTTGNRLTTTVIVK